MNLPTRPFAGFLILLLVCLCKPAAADLALRFSDDNGENFSNSFDVQVSNSLNIGFYLQQTGAETILTDEGLVSFGFDLSRNDTSSGTISNRSVNTFFDTEERDVTTAIGFEWDYGQDSATGLRGDTILLGTFQFNSTGEGAAVFTVGDRMIGSGLANGSWFTPSLETLDEQIFGPLASNQFQFSVNSISAVPEPSSFIVLSCIAGLAIGRRKRRP